MNIALFAYNFPHKKTQDFLLKLFLEGYTPKVILATNAVALKVPKVSIRIKPKFINLIPPKVIAERMDIPYYVISHNTNKVVALLKQYDINIGIIAGARILKKHIIDAIPGGIINFHPGAIPEARGLNALERSILRDIPPMVTAHFIDSRVDAGRIIMKKKIKLYADDTIIDVSLRLYETQLVMLPEVLRIVEGTPPENFNFISEDMITSTTPLTEEDVKAAVARFGDYLIRHREDTDI